ncbi:MAG: hypothetical protein ACYC96_06360 [Fimbriimonadaceae bacterium]
MTPQAPPNIDPLDVAGIRLTTFSVEELEQMWEQSGGEQKLQAHLAALDVSGTITEEVLMSIVQGRKA